MNPLEFSIIITIYERKEELRDLLNSLANQIDSKFEIIIVDDGSPTPLSHVVKEFEEKLNIKYYYKKNSGPALSRNYGMSRAQGNYFIFLDSDTIIPKDYLKIIRKKLLEKYTDAFGGPDDSIKEFSNLQKAISFSMTSILTTGGIRGGNKSVTKFQPRSFNMGISRKAFENTKGFSELRIGEDPDLSMTLWEKGFETQLIKEAKVYHKRRSSLKKFFIQVYNFGIARPILNQRHPKYKSITFWFPSFFLIGICFSIIIIFISELFLPSKLYHLRKSLFTTGYSFLGLYMVYFIAILVFSSIRNNSIKVGVLSVLTTCVQFIGYGFGFLKSWTLLNVFRLNARKTFPSHFSE